MNEKNIVRMNEKTIEITTAEYGGLIYARATLDLLSKIHSSVSTYVFEDIVKGVFQDSKVDEEKEDAE